MIDSNMLNSVITSDPPPTVLQQCRGWLTGGSRASMSSAGILRATCAQLRSHYHLNSTLRSIYVGHMPISLLKPSFHSALKPKSPISGNVERPVTITGRLSKPVTSVTINQQQATLEQGGLAFSFPRFFLREGTNMITAVATDAKGRIVSSAITVSVDQTAPLINIEHPKTGHITRAAWVDIRGMVNDAVEGAFGAPEPSISITGANNGNGSVNITGQAKNGVAHES